MHSLEKECNEVGMLTASTFLGLRRKLNSILTLNSLYDLSHSREWLRV